MTRFDFIRHYYKLPFVRRGLKVRYKGTEGRITSADGAHLRIVLDGDKKPLSYHPTYEIDYMDIVNKMKILRSKVTIIAGWGYYINLKNVRIKKIPVSADTSYPWLGIRINMN